MSLLTDHIMNGYLHLRKQTRLYKHKIEILFKILGRDGVYSTVVNYSIYHSQIHSYGNHIT